MWREVAAGALRWRGPEVLLLAVLGGLVAGDVDLWPMGHVMYIPPTMVQVNATLALYGNSSDNSFPIKMNADGLKCTPAELEACTPADEDDDACCAELFDEDSDGPEATATVTSLELVLLAFLFPLLVLLSIAAVRHGTRLGAAVLLRPRKTHVSSWDEIVGCCYAFVYTAVLTDVFKAMVGRPRPIYYALRIFAHKNPASDWEELIDTSTRSFPSGHSSLSFGGLGYLTLSLLGEVEFIDWDALAAYVAVCCTGTNTDGRNTSAASAAAAAAATTTTTTTGAAIAVAAGTSTPTSTVAAATTPPRGIEDEGEGEGKGREHEAELGIVKAHEAHTAALGAHHAYTDEEAQEPLHSGSRSPGLLQRPGTGTGTGTGNALGCAAVGGMDNNLSMGRDLKRLGAMACMHLAILPLTIAVWIAVTRVIDYWHFPSDVVMGVTLGCIVSAYSYFFLRPLRVESPAYPTSLP